jgi:hypothetical protein
MNTNQALSTTLPLRHKLTLVYALSAIIAILMAAAAGAGLLYRTAVYPADDLLHSFVPTDVTFLLIGLPMLLASIWLSRRGKLIGLLFWPGALFYVLYNYLTYLLSMPLNAAFLLHLALVVLSLYTLIGLLAAIDGKAVQGRLAGAVPERLAGGVPAGLGFLFCLRAFGVLVSALVSGTPLTATEFALNISDFVTAPAWVVCGVLLWRRKELGYVTGLGLLFQASMLFIGLIVVMLIQPTMTSVPYSPVDVVVVFIMGFVCFIPFALVIRGVSSVS